MEEPANRGGLGEFVVDLHCLAGPGHMHPDGPLVRVVLGGNLQVQVHATGKDNGGHTMARSSYTSAG